MSSIIFLKKIENYSPEHALEAFKQAATKADMFCILTRTKSSDGRFVSGEGTLSEVDEAAFLNTDNKEHLKYFTFNINPVDQDSYDSFTWLTQNEKYFWTIDIENIKDDYAFIYHFVIAYFRDHPEDYLWFDDADWYYTAKDLFRLSNMPYNPLWSSEKIV